MRLRRLYSNKPTVFEPIIFKEGLSAILAEIRVPANRQLDTHNLGKTTVGELLDYCLLKGKSSRFFLFKHEARFADFVFYLEVELPSGEFLTIARPVRPGSRVDFLRSASPVADATPEAGVAWTHTNLPFERAKLLLDGLLGFDALRPWGFRKLAGYLVRTQRDYLDVFQLGKFSGKHQDWKPFVAHLLGMDGEVVHSLYDRREQLTGATAHLQSLNREWGTDDADPSVLDGLISLKRRDVHARMAALDSFNFREEDRRVTADVVERVEATIVVLNDEAYQLAQVLRRLSDSLEEQRITFRPTEAEVLFREAGVAFGDQLKRDYNQLIKFHRAITEERREALQQQADETSARLTAIQEELRGLHAARAESLDFLRESDTLAKYKGLSEDLTRVRADLNLLEAKREAAARLLELRREQRTLQEQLGHLETEVETQLDSISRDEQGTFGRLRRYFGDIVQEVLGQDAIIAIRMNRQGGLEFTAEFIGEEGTATSGDQGTSYRKLLCIAFDLAMLRTYLDVPFARFVYHDGALEQLERRKREKLIGVLRDYSNMGLQPVISLLDSDLPAPLGASADTLAPEEVILTLHDEGEDGRLFKMPTW